MVGDKAEKNRAAAVVEEGDARTDFSIAYDICTTCQKRDLASSKNSKRP